MTPLRTIETVTGPIHGTIRPPGSKSLTNRGLLLAALASGTSELHGLLDSEDTRVMVRALESLGLALDIDWTQCRARVSGGGGRFPNQGPLSLDIRNSGTSIRFLTAALTATGGNYVLQGVPRMQERPIGDLIRALQQLGGGVAAEKGDAFPPVRIASSGLEGGRVTLRGNLSSQYLSGLLMASPLARHPVDIEISGELISRPYVQMTLHNMAAFGVEVVGDLAHTNRLHVEPQSYRGVRFEIEPDASAASYFFAAAAICGGSARILGLHRQSIQGDLQFVACLERMGCQVVWNSDSIEVQGPAKVGIEINMADFSDTVQTLAAVSLFVATPTTIRGVSHNRLKETDRISDLARELRKLGAHVDEFPDGLRITPAPLRGCALATYDDHRMAMSLALVGLKVPGVSLENPGCVGKTYPDFFDDLDRFLKSA